jgi:hypothetical protein
MTGAVIRPTMTRAAQAAVLGGVCARAADGAASKNVMSSASQRSNLMVSLPYDLKKYIDQLSDDPLDWRTMSSKGSTTSWES